MALDAWRNHGENERTAQAGVTLGLNPADPNAVLAARAYVWSEYNIQQISSSVPFSGPDLTAVQEAVALNEFAHPGTAGRADQGDAEAITQLQALAAATLESRKYQPANAAPAVLSTMSFARVQYECPEACGVPGTPFLGGAYGCIKGGDTVGHHTPMNAASYLPLFLGPAIQMDPADHLLLPSSRRLGDALSAALFAALAIRGFSAAAKLGDAEVELYFPSKYTDAFHQRDIYIKCLARNNLIKE